MAEKVFTAGCLIMVVGMTLFVGSFPSGIPILMGWGWGIMMVSLFPIGWGALCTQPKPTETVSQMLDRESLKQAACFKRYEAEFRQVFEGLELQCYWGPTGFDFLTFVRRNVDPLRGMKAETIKEAIKEKWGPRAGSLITAMINLR